MKLSSISVIFIIIILPIILVFSYYISLQLDTINMQTTYNTKLLDATKSAIEAFEINTVEWNEDYSTVGNSKRRDVMAAINTFTTSFANALGVGGTNKGNIMTYIPAVAFTLYDGYYIYSPANTKEIIIDENGGSVFMTQSLAKNKNKNGAKLSGYTYKAEDAGKILYVATVGKAQGVYTSTSGVSQSFTLDPNDALSKYEHMLKPFVSYSARYENETEDTDVVINYTLDNYITINGKVKGKYENRARIFSRRY